MIRKKTYYTDGFRESAVKLAVESKKSFKETADALDVNPNTLYSWINKYYKGKKQLHPCVTNEDLKNKEIIRLKGEVIRLKKERAILREAASVFVSYCK